MGVGLEDIALGATIRPGPYASKHDVLQADRGSVLALQPGLPSPHGLASQMDMSDPLSNFDDVGAAYSATSGWPGFSLDDCHLQRLRLPAQLPSPPHSQSLEQPSDEQQDAFDEIFTFEVEPRTTDFVFGPVERIPWPRAAKRFRARHDVDGPRTAGLSCKKRRLRHELITSRLSQPFSLPATHIINREAVAAGDKRFMKLAASASAGRRCPSSQGSLIRRAALLNCTRTHVQERLHESEGILLSAAAHRSMLQRGQQQSSTSGRFWTVTAHPDNRQTSSRVWMIRSKPGEASPSSLSHVASHAAVSSPASLACGLSMSAAAARRLSKSPLLRPARSPILGPADGRLDEVGDDEETAFPEDNGRYGSADEDDADDVYSDFGAIFGTAQDAESPDHNENRYEDCLDELDGILGW